MLSINAGPGGSHTDAAQTTTKAHRNASGPASTTRAICFRLKATGIALQGAHRRRASIGMQHVLHESLSIERRQNITWPIIYQ